MMIISDEAKKMVKKMQEESASPELKPTLHSAGVGCGAPVIKLEMRPPFKDDIIEEISGVTIHIRPAIIKFTDNAEISVEETFWGPRLKVNTINGCR